MRNLKPCSMTKEEYKAIREWFNYIKNAVWEAHKYPLGW